MTNIAELLKDCPKGTKLYSPLFGEVELLSVDDLGTIFIKNLMGTETFNLYGCFYSNHAFKDAECLLFPSKEVRTWEGWQAPKPHYDIANFKPFDKVLIRVGNKSKWSCDFFSYYNKGFHCVGTDDWSQCIPFNDDTKHLLGTTDMPSEEFINW